MTPMVGADPMQEYLAMVGGGAPTQQPDQLAAQSPLPPEMEAGEAVDPQLVTGVIELEPGLRVARSIAQKVIDIENKCGVHCVEGYRERFTNKRRAGTAEHSYHQMTEDGHGAADFEGTPRQLQNALAHAQNLGAIEADIHNDGRGQLLHVAW